MPRLPAHERRAQLLEVAAELFARHGYRGTTTAELARAAGISEPILYRHFENKHQLFLDLIEAAGEAVLAEWQARLNAAAGAEARLHVLLDNNPATDPRGRGIYRVFFGAFAEQEDPDVRAALRRHVRRLHTFLTTVLESLAAVGTVRHDVPAASLAWSLIDVGAGYALLSPVQSDRVQVEHHDAVVDRLEETLRGG